MTDKPIAGGKLVRKEGEESEILDLLLVGGGPGGTTAAFRAKELGLNALVIDYDDLLKRIRDYASDKLILPAFGGGDKVKFPDGGELVKSLYFDPIDKDDMCRHWKALYKEHRVPYRLGLELTGMKQLADGTIKAFCWNQEERCEVVLLTRYLVLGIGCGVPRRFDIPGNTDGISFRMTDPENYVGEPACVIGGGTSAAEAVIAISGAKRKNNDPTNVFWSYRGDRLPKVSKALDRSFFEAYVGNGNIRYYPHSEPAAIISGDDHRDYLSIRVDRKTMQNRPHETVHLEFPKENCLACIGEDLPEGLLANLGIAMVHGGPRGRKRMVVRPTLESKVPGVFIIGDLLSQAYFETNDFNADPTQFREVKHRGNIKSAMRDGVMVAQVIKQRMDGIQEADCTVADAGYKETEVDVQRTIHSIKSPELQPKPDAEAGKAAAWLVRILPSGVVENEYPIFKRQTTLGRRYRDISFPEDSMMDDHHATLIKRPDGIYLRDEDSPTGLFFKMPEATKKIIKAGDLMRLGQQFLLFGGLAGEYWFKHYDQKGQEAGHHAIGRKTMIIGREAPQVSLNPNDKTLSRRHLAVAEVKGQIIIKDLKSANGSYLRLMRETRLEHGDIFQAGQATFIFSTAQDAVLDTGAFETPAVLKKAKPIDPQPKRTPVTVGDGPAQVNIAGPSVTFVGLGGPFPAKAGQSLCDVAEANGISINAECHAGVCGSDPLEIISGAENLASPPNDTEIETLEDICELDPNHCRLACMARIKGPVTVKIV